MISVCLDDVTSVKSEEGLTDSQLVNVAADDVTPESIAAVDTTAENTAADDMTESMSSVVLRHNRHSMAMAFDRDTRQDSECVSYYETFYFVCFMFICTSICGTWVNWIYCILQLDVLSQLPDSV